MCNLVIIFGPQAVGKTTIGLELEKITGYKLFHNHMTIDLVAPFFDNETPVFRKLVSSFREKMFQEFAKSEIPGIIFTYVMAFNSKRASDFLEKTVNIFEKEGGRVYYVDLEASIETRLKRNRTPLRLQLKPNKRNLKRSELSLMDYENRYVHNSDGSHFPRESYLKINNEKISAQKAAFMIKERFKL